MKVYVVTGLDAHDVFVFTKYRKAMAQAEEMNRTGDNALVHEVTVNEGEEGESQE